MIFTVHGEVTSNKQTCKKWFAGFSVGDFSLRSRLIEVDSNYDIT